MISGIKINRRDEHLVDILLNKQLEKYNTTIEDIMLFPNTEINGRPWFQYYTFDSDQEWLNWKDFCVNFLMKNVKPKFSKKEAEREFFWLDFNYGLRHNY